MLLVALILFLRSLAPGGPDRTRVLVAAHTNAAVDRVLLGLAAHGLTGKDVKSAPSTGLQTRICYVMSNPADKAFKVPLRSAPVCRLPASGQPGAHQQGRAAALAARDIS
jgi:hypothetical protein